MEQKIQQTENIGMVIGLLKSKDIRTRNPYIFLNKIN